MSDGIFLTLFEGLFSATAFIAGRSSTNVHRTTRLFSPRKLSIDSIPHSLFVIGYTKISMMQYGRIRVLTAFCLSEKSPETKLYRVIIIYLSIYRINLYSGTNLESILLDINWQLDTIFF